MRLLVCGSREWSGAWEDIAAHFPEDDTACHGSGLTVIHGGCSRIVDGVQVSVDYIAGWIARRLGHDVEEFSVDHRLDGPWPAAGPRRNARMLRDGKPTHGLAFGALWRISDSPRGKPWKLTGTGGMVSLMLADGVPVRWVASSDFVHDLVTMPPAPSDRPACVVRGSST